MSRFNYSKRSDPRGAHYQVVDNDRRGWGVPCVCGAVWKEEDAASLTDKLESGEINPEYETRPIDDDLKHLN